MTAKDFEFSLHDKHRAYADISTCLGRAHFRAATDDGLPNSVFAATGDAMDEVVHGPLLLHPGKAIHP
jgi:hypothetical protein